MSIHINTNELCSSCLAIGDGFIEDTLTSNGYTAHGPVNQAMLNNMILINLEDKGGCPSCIAVVRRYVSG